MNTNWLHSPMLKSVMLAVLYFVTGKLGLLLAVPPGYATVIWPPSGIALGMLVVYGWRLWPGVLAGSFLLNCYISDAYSVDDGLVQAKVLVAFGIAIGSTVQALIGRALIARFVGLPIELQVFKKVFLLLFLAGPLACVIAATVGTGLLYANNLLVFTKILDNWETWWLGDMFGVIVFLPLMLIMPGTKSQLMFRGNPLGVLPVVAMLVLIVPLGLTFYAWKVAYENDYQRNKLEFESLTMESEKAMLHRMESYKTALLGGDGFFQGSENVSRAEWRNYIEAIQLWKNFPGVNGIGWVKPVESTDIAAYLRKGYQERGTDFFIHPVTKNLPYYIITYIEPEQMNRPAIGLNIAFEAQRLHAADLARDTGNPTITRHITLVQDDKKGSGFLLLHPMYKKGQPLITVEEKRSSFRGWIYAAFMAEHFFKDLTKSQGYMLNLRVYDGNTETEDALIYKSNTRSEGDSSLFTVRKELKVMQQTWLVVWESTPVYERLNGSNNPLFMLVGGLLFTGMFALFLIVTTMRYTDSIEHMAGEHQFALPVVIFFILSLGTWELYGTLQEKELNYIKGFTQEEASKLELLLTSQIDDKLMVLKRMAQRWEKAGGTPFALWQADAENFTKQLAGLKAVEWVDANYHVRWVVPMIGNEKAVGINVMFDQQRKAMLKDAAKKHTPTLTPPLDLIQGYKAFIAYLPVYVHGKFDGFIVGIFSIDAFFESALSKEIKDHFAFSVSYAGKDFYSNGLTPALKKRPWHAEKDLQIFDKSWKLRMTPTQQFIEMQQTPLPEIVCISGLLIAILSALTVRYILISRLKSNYLEKSNQALQESNSLKSAVLFSTRYLVVATTKEGIVTVFNDAAEKMLGYKADEVVGKVSPAIWHDQSEVRVRAEELSQEFGVYVAPGFDVFVKKAERSGAEEREWTFIRKDGTYFPGNLTVTPLRDTAGETRGYLGVIEDITRRKEQQEALKNSEETFRAAMENAAIGMALVQPDGRWLKVNQALSTLLGYSEEELLGRDFQSITHPDDLEQDLKYVRQLLADETKTYHMEKRYHHKSGHVIWVLLSVSLVRHTNGEPHYFITQIQDITERKEMERIKSEFISIVSHELRTPLTSIRGSLGLILGALSQGLPDKVKGLIEIAHNNCERLILLINDILDIDKIASGQMRFNCQEECLATITRQAVEANEAYAQKFQITLVLDPIEEDITVKLDEARYAQVLSNLLSNAAKFSQQGEKVHIYALLEEGNVRICVKDHGPGIQEEFRSRIFNKFSQADSSATRSKGGTGLGLHITKQIVEHMGGHIGFDTETGKGTTFWIMFPFVQGKKAKAAEKVETSPAARLELSELPRILHIEDDLDLSHVLETALQGKAQLVLATTIAHAEELLETQSFSLIMMDIVMPDGMAVTLLPRIKARAGKAIPVVILSANMPEESMQELVDLVLVKSCVSEAKIVESILQVIEQSRRTV